VKFINFFKQGRSDGGGGADGAIASSEMKNFPYLLPKPKKSKFSSIRSKKSLKFLIRIKKIKMSVKIFSKTSIK
jgi:hypothetical protein